MTLGNKVKKRHEELGISQSKLAEMTKISQPGISRLENGRYTPSSPLVVVLAKANSTDLNLMLMSTTRAQRIKRNGVCITICGEKYWYSCRYD